MRQEYITVGGKTYCYVDQAPKSQPKGTLLCLHGFPDQWYGWGSQISAWSLAGYRVIVPHMLGYGQSDKPADPFAYSTKNLCRDLALLLDGLQLERTVIVGHDWGAAVAWRFALWYPHRTIALVALSVPYFPPSKVYIAPSEVTKRVPTFAYQEYFADPSSTREIDAAIEVFIPALFQRHKSARQGRSFPILRPGEMQALVQGDKENFQTLATVVPAHEIQRYIQDFQQGGMNGPLSYYRNTRSRFDNEKDARLPSKFPSHIPVLFLYGTLDGTCPHSYVARMPEFIKDLKVIPLQDKGHWVLLEATEQVNTEVLAFLDVKGGGGSMAASIASVRL